MPCNFVTHLETHAYMTKIQYALAALLLLAGATAGAQESMMQNVDYAFLDKLIFLAKQNYPQMHKYEHKLAQANYGVKKAQLGWFEALTFSYTYGNNGQTATGTNGGTITYQPGLFLNLGVLMERIPTIKMAREDLAIAKEDMAQYNLSIEAAVRTRYILYVQKQSILTLRTMSSNDAENAQKQVKYKFEKGEETFDNYSKSLVMFSVSTQNKIEAEGAALIAKSDLEEMIGMKLEDVKK